MCERGWAQIRKPRQQKRRGQFLLPKASQALDLAVAWRGQVVASGIPLSYWDAPGLVRMSCHRGLGGCLVDQTEARQRSSSDSTLM